jgi:response regulator RpfG family c-di-GMP phosphodiesterase
MGVCPCPYLFTLFIYYLFIEVAEKELLKNRGVLYDPQVVDACLKVIKKKQLVSIYN